MPLYLYFCDSVPIVIFIGVSAFFSFNVTGIRSINCKGVGVCTYVVVEEYYVGHCRHQMAMDGMGYEGGCGGMVVTGMEKL